MVKVSGLRAWSVRPRVSVTGSIIRSGLHGGLGVPRHGGVNVVVHLRIMLWFRDSAFLGVVRVVVTMTLLFPTPCANV
jgi:hypothetical protein